MGLVQRLGRQFGGKGGGKTWLLGVTFLVLAEKQTLWLMNFVFNVTLDKDPALKAEDVWDVGYHWTSFTPRYLPALWSAFIVCMTFVQFWTIRTENRFAVLKHVVAVWCVLGALVWQLPFLSQTSSSLSSQSQCDAKLSAASLPDLRSSCWANAMSFTFSWHAAFATTLVSAWITYVDDAVKCNLMRLVLCLALVSNVASRSQYTVDVVRGWLLTSLLWRWYDYTFVQNRKPTSYLEADVESAEFTAQAQYRESVQWAADNLDPAGMSSHQYRSLVDRMCQDARFMDCQRQRHRFQREMDESPSNLAKIDASRNRVRHLYLASMRSLLVNSVYRDEALFFADPHRGPNQGRLTVPNKRLHTQRLADQWRLNGHDVPKAALAKVGHQRLEHFERLVEQMVVERVPGDLVDVAVWRGGVALFWRAILRTFDDNDRVVHAFCSKHDLADIAPLLEKTLSVVGAFTPTATLVSKALLWASGTQHDENTRRWLEFSMRHPDLLRQAQKGTTRQDVEEMAQRTGMNDSQLQLHDSAISFDCSESISLVRLQGFDQVKLHLAQAYDKVSPGGFVVIEDYGSSSKCRAAIAEFRDTCQIHSAIVAIDHNAVCWRKPRAHD